MVRTSAATSSAIRLQLVMQSPSMWLFAPVRSARSMCDRLTLGTAEFSGEPSRSLVSTVHAAVGPTDLSIEGISASGLGGAPLADKHRLPEPGRLGSYRRTWKEHPKHEAIAL